MHLERYEMKRKYKRRVKIREDGNHLGVEFEDEMTLVSVSDYIIPSV